MKLLITGSTGLLGRNLVSQIIKKHEVYILFRDKVKIDILRDLPHITPLYGDLFQFDTNNIPDDIDGIFYLAHSKKFKDLPKEFIDLFEINVYSPLKLVDWATKNGVKKFYYTSTGGIYNATNNPNNENDTIIGTPCKGLYPDSKLVAEILLLNYASFFDSFAILRPFFIYGPGQDQNMLIPRLINNIEQENQIFLNGKDGIKINPIFVSDAALALDKLISTRGKHIINIAGDEIVTIGELSRNIGKIIGKIPKFSYSQCASNNLIGDNLLMKKMLIEPKISLEVGLTKVIESMNR